MNTLQDFIGLKVSQPGINHYENGTFKGCSYASAVLLTRLSRDQLQFRTLNRLQQWNTESQKTNKTLNLLVFISTKTIPDLTA